MLRDSCEWRWSSVLEEGGTYELHSAIQTFEEKKCTVGKYDDLIIDKSMYSKHWRNYNTISS